MSKLHPMFLLDGRIMTPTGRGSFRFVEKTSLEELLVAYDRAYPDFTDDPREDVIAAYREAETHAMANVTFGIQAVDRSIDTLAKR
ncbi:hypothetical protein [Mesorhizobium sp. YR577]|uniref:hypothetical protein n=1 Tax=Mesorhizobium sp. YR577 TaxID=1884373 RepID=UPI0008E6AF2B|nr:hypothetical protein [Mesorhizobium sp. YR577]SFU21042.1 hypothetical protein SAMN05518861_12548 [Mesorhizobium sp. YR577]